MLSKFEILAHLSESISSPESRARLAEGALLKGHKQEHRARRSRFLGQNCFLLGVFPSASFIPQRGSWYLVPESPLGELPAESISWVVWSSEIDTWLYCLFSDHGPGALGSQSNGTLVEATSLLTFASSASNRDAAFWHGASGSLAGAWRILTVGSHCLGKPAKPWAVCFPTTSSSSASKGGQQEERL